MPVLCALIIRACDTLSMHSALAHVPRKDTTGLVCAVFIWEGYLGRLTPKVVDATLALSVGTAWLSSGRPAGPVELTRRSSPPFVRYAGRSRNPRLEAAIPLPERRIVAIIAGHAFPVFRPSVTDLLIVTFSGPFGAFVPMPLVHVPLLYRQSTCLRRQGVPEVCTPVHSARCLTFCRSLAAAGLRLFFRGMFVRLHPRAPKERGEIRSELFPGAASCTFPNAGLPSFAIIPFPMP